MFVGHVSPRLPARAARLLESLPNVHVLGPVDRKGLPPYISHLDVALLPYLEDEWGAYGSPLKIWDYLYAGPPIVGSGYLELQDFPPPLIRFNSGVPAFIASVEEALAEDGAGRSIRRKYALENTWDDRARQLDRVVEEAMARR